MKATRGFARLQRLLLVFIILVAYSIYFSRFILTRHQAQLAMDFDSDVLKTWAEFIEGFPVHPKDRYAMHEMGFRTSVYAHLLEALDDYHSDMASRLRFAIWDFLPTIDDGTDNVLEKRDISHAQELSSLSKFRTDKSMSSRISRLKKSPIKKIKRRGLVTVIEKDELRSAIELIATLRYSLKDDIEIEVFYYGENDLPELIREAFSMMTGVRTIDLKTIPLYRDEVIDAMGLETMNKKRTTALQALALLASEFEEVVFAAPGVLFFEKPEILLHQEDFQRTGTYFFHGLNTPQLADSNRFLNYLRQQFDHAHPSVNLASSPFYNFGGDKHQDSRVLALDKSRPSVFSALLLNLWMHSPQVRDLIWHAHFPECLTETIWLSFELAQVPYYFEPAYAGGIGEYEGPLDDLPWQPTICPAHALNFIGRKSYASRGGKPFWMDGGLKLFPHHERYLGIQAWSPRGRWEQTNLGMCLIGADAHSPEEYNLASKIEEHKIVDETFVDIFSSIFDVYGLSIL